MIKINKKLKGNMRTYKKRMSKPFGIKLNGKNQEVEAFNNLYKAEHTRIPKFRHKAFVNAHVDQRRGTGRWEKSVNPTNPGHKLPLVIRAEANRLDKIRRMN